MEQTRFKSTNCIYITKRYNLDDGGDGGGNDGKELVKSSSVDGVQLAQKAT